MGVLLYHDALRIEKIYRGNISTVIEYNLSQAYHKTVEFYVDDIAVKRRDKGDHLADLKKYLTSCGHIN